MTGKKAHDTVHNALVLIRLTSNGISDQCTNEKESNLPKTKNEDSCTAKNAEETAYCLFGQPSKERRNLLTYIIQF